MGDAIDYINELKRTVGELKILVEKKRCSRERVKRQKAAENGGELIKTDMVVDDHPYSNNIGSTLRSSWLHRKSKSTEVDVRIVDDEVTVKLVQQKRINCLLFVSKVLDELQLDLHHVAGGLIGDSYSFLFNSKVNKQVNSLLKELCLINWSINREIKPIYVCSRFVKVPQFMHMQ